MPNYINVFEAFIIWNVLWLVYSLSPLEGCSELQVQQMNKSSNFKQVQETS